MYYPVGAFTGLYVHKDMPVLTTRKREALCFKTKKELSAWVKVASRNYWFTFIVIKDKPKKKGKKK